ncbi:hypothetical protein GLOIN_2v1623729 [Rhizophagus irregularis DAOM 181602=DAOM 197198]|uniref:Uncharacterized protein n=1 Tax=Rhizophagus irregularis (strain DAOM 181602 / DAOM 197198 / MUCL 43194) TaxID=747089 RepID=A0A2P4PWF9_RHIID|nr:hypothetical protein GLOIN_2v1623729 [Rhizophagus irregularis DAOM 181602=DAOM 197198]POG69723.1 hypothetical protein GLOIN_2v1623729 [Rhizophagus irregularis DAOM 181602=DAOM 197198]|eukprot:XP_025176589.1 hypothetical protein GLOIN_2v1623729 [Rhizophagus irregularis DAOM 181602=DAOM 197198]
MIIIVTWNILISCWCIFFVTIAYPRSKKHFFFLRKFDMIMEKKKFFLVVFFYWYKLISSFS